MKKRVLVLGLIMAFALVGCGGNDTKVIEGSVQTKTEGKEAVAEAEKEVPGAAEETTEVSYKGFAYILNDVALEIDAEAGPIIEALGEADSYFESPSCAFEGIDKIYTYGSIQLETYPMEEKDFVSSITFKDDSVTTMEGVGIGDSLDKVKEVYGADGTGEGGMITYKKDGMKLCFVIQDDAVAAIEYRSTVLDE